MIDFSMVNVDNCSGNHTGTFGGALYYKSKGWTHEKR